MAMRYYAPFPGGGGYPPWRPEPHALRIGDAERDAAAADLSEHFVAGRLTLDELNQRLDAVFTAKTFGQLAKTMIDLPGPGRLPWPAGPWVNGAPHAPAGQFAGHRPADPPMSAGRAGRLAALSLLLLAMLIWLFTALLFARHGFAYHPGPYGPPGSFDHYVPSGTGGSGSPFGP